ncbi:MAG: hypothetical protein H2058_06655 [Muricauda sp.]|nr:hypothetical protein [Allomuricauda sp.]MBA4744919.1 hypothetical protein [Allomuricauda sp.]
MQINQEDLKKLVSDFKKESNILEAIVEPILNKNTLPKKEILEVCQVAKFSKDIDESIKILNKGLPPNPDFIIEHNKILKGLEHTRILNSEAKNILKTKSFVEYIENRFLEIYPKLNILVYISFQENFTFIQSQKRDIANIIIDTIYKMYSGEKYQIPHFLTQLRIMSHSLLVFEYEENYSSPKYLPKEELINGIRKKEKNIKTYKQSQKGLKEFWLLLLLDTTSSTSYIIDENTDYTVSTIFDRVYLMEDLGSKIVRID